MPVLCQVPRKIRKTLENEIKFVHPSESFQDGEGMYLLHPSLPQGTCNIFRGRVLIPYAFLCFSQGELNSSFLVLSYYFALVK